MNLLSTRLFASGVGAAALLAISACASAPVRPDFEAALDSHLATIAARDIDGYLATITNDEEMTLIFPQGQAVFTRAEVEAFHREWFTDPDWRMDIERVRIIEGADMALALVRTTYRDAEDGAGRDAFLVLVFRLENGEWRLAHDQNTRIVAEEN